MAKSKRNKNNRNRKRSKAMVVYPVKEVDTVSNMKKVVDFVPRTPKKKPAKVPRLLGKLSPRDMTFLKAAFAPVDFGVLDVQGVPDVFTGTSLIKHHTLRSTISITSAGWYSILVAPVPGIAYFSTNGYKQDDSFVMMASSYPDTPEMFGTITGSDTTWNVMQSRHISNVVEIRPTSSIVTNAGHIICAKLAVPLNPMYLSDPAVETPPTGKGYWALASQAEHLAIDLTFMNPDRLTRGEFYMGHINDGLYSVAANTGDWSFKPIFKAVESIPPASMTYLQYDTTTMVAEKIAYKAMKAPDGRLKVVSDGTRPLPGWNEHECIAILIKADAACAFTVETHSVVEYIPNPSSMLYPYATPSAPPSPLALAAYAEVAGLLPVAVGYTQNADFWDRVSDILKQLLSVGSRYGASLNMVYPGLGTVVSATSGLLNSLL